MTWYRTYMDSGQKEAILEDIVRDRLAGHYRDVDLAILAAKEQGQPLRTSFALYEYKKEQIPDA